MSKIRVHELAKELGKQNKDILNFLAEKGIEVKSHMSSIENEQIELVKKKFGKAEKEDYPGISSPEQQDRDRKNGTKAKAGRASPGQRSTSPGWPGGKDGENAGWFGR